MKEKKIRKIIIEKTDWYTRVLGLNSWDGHVNFSGTIKEDRWGTATVAETFADWRYLRFSITYYLKTLTDYSEEEIERVIIHELAHIFLNEMRYDGVEHEERVASMLQRAFSRLEATLRRDFEEELDDMLEEEPEEEKEVVEVENDQTSTN